MNAPVRHLSVDSQVRHATWMRAYTATPDRATPARREAATIAAHDAADRAWRGLDDALADAALYAERRLLEAGLPDHVAGAVADAVHRVACSKILEAAR